MIVVVDIDAVDALVERVVAHRVARLDFIEPIDVLQEPNQELCIDDSLATSWLYSCRSPKLASVRLARS